MSDKGDLGIDRVEPREGRIYLGLPDAMRVVTLETGVNRYAEGSCMVTFGHTKVLVTASLEEGVPGFLRGKGQGWVTAEYGMLPRATHTRGRREAAQGKQSGRTQEIQRLIGRSLRAVTDLKALGERQISVDCDVVQADGGTRTAAITGAWVALRLATKHLMEEGVIKADPILDVVAAISCGIYKDVPVLDLEYEEDQFTLNKNSWIQGLNIWREGTADNSIKIESHEIVLNDSPG